MIKSFVKMEYGSTGAEVTKAQKLLQKAGSAIKVNGEFTIGMTTAVKSFQKKHNLPVNGIIDSKTMKKLEAAAAEKPAKKSVPSKKAPAKKNYTLADAYPILSQKSTLPGYVKELQTLLTKAGYKLPKTTKEGVFTAGTLTALHKFQKDKGLKVEDRVDRKAWSELLKYE